MTNSSSTTRPAGNLEALAAAPFAGLRSRRSRERLLESILHISGERGYERATVKLVIEHAGTSRATFYNHFEDKEDCFVQAYVEASEWLYDRIHALSVRQPTWRDRLRVGLAELLEFCANNPAIAKALFIEAHAAGGEALAHHDQMMERVSRAIDNAREEGEQVQSPPGMTSTFMVGAIEALITAKLSSDEAAKAPELLPGILHFVVMQYLGREAAWEEMTSASTATWDARRRAASGIA